MLYDPKWQQKNDKTHAGISLLALIAWLETKPSFSEYLFEDPLACLAAKFLQETTGCDRFKSIVDFGFSFGPDGGYSPASGAWLYAIVGSRPRTYGSALERARATLAAGDT